MNTYTQWSSSSITYSWRSLSFKHRDNLESHNLNHTFKAAKDVTRIGICHEISVRLGWPFKMLCNALARPPQNPHSVSYLVSSDFYWQSLSAHQSNYQSTSNELGIKHQVCARLCWRSITIYTYRTTLSMGGKLVGGTGTLLDKRECLTYSVMLKILYVHATVAAGKIVFKLVWCSICQANC